MTYNIIETFNLTKEFKIKKQKKKLIALNNVNLSVKKGEIFGLLGPNGAGKTTLIRVLSTILKPTSGYATIDGYDIFKENKKAKFSISIMLGSAMSYADITGYKNLKFISKIYKIPNYKEKIYRLAEEFELEKFLNHYVRFYSSGMRMKLAIIRALLIDREIMFLDEPTAGLDIISKSYVVNKLKNINKTLFITSHDMDAMEKLCDRIAFIKKGEIIKIGTREDIKKFKQEEIKIEVNLIKNKNQLKNELNHSDFISNLIETEKGFIVFIKNLDNYKDLFNILRNYKIRKIKEHDSSLEDFFLQLV